MRRGILLGVCATAALATPGVADARLSVQEAAARLGTSTSGLEHQTGLGRSALGGFVRGSQSVGGLTERQVLLALRRPALIASIPVAAESGPLASASRRIPRRGCRKSGGFVKLKSGPGFRLWTFSISQRWCWNRHLRRVSVVPHTTEVHVNIAQGAAIAGWDYKGLDEGGKSGFYYHYRGSGRRGAHSTYRRGVMQYCPVRVGCFNTRRPGIRLGVRWTGTAWAKHAVG
jgi:hypothetical protein